MQRYTFSTMHLDAGAGNRLNPADALGRFNDSKP